jgi:hypothetical protein
MSPHWQPFLSLHGISDNIRNSSRQSANASTNENRTPEIFKVKQNEEYGGK